MAAAPGTTGKRSTSWARSSGALAQNHAVGQCGHRLQISEEPELLQVNRQLLRVFSQVGGHQQLNAILADGPVSREISAAGNVGIDRYLGERTGSRRDGNQVDGGSTTLPLYVIRGVLADRNLHCFNPLNNLWYGELTPAAPR